MRTLADHLWCCKGTPCCKIDFGDVDREIFLLAFERTVCESGCGGEVDIAVVVPEKLSELERFRR
jgi:hypothetical protein